MNKPKRFWVYVLLNPNRWNIRLLIRHTVRRMADSNPPRGDSGSNNWGSLFPKSVTWDFPGDTDESVKMGNWLNLNRYETTLDMQFYKALHELLRLQSARRGEKPPLPIAIDVDVSKDG